jgi:hypothetical protein
MLRGSILDVSPRDAIDVNSCRGAPIVGIGRAVLSSTRHRSSEEARLVFLHRFLLALSNTSAISGTLVTVASERQGRERGSLTGSPLSGRLSGAHSRYCGGFHRGSGALIEPTLANIGRRSRIRSVRRYERSRGSSVPTRTQPRTMDPGKKGRDLGSGTRQI